MEFQPNYKGWKPGWGMPPELRKWNFSLTTRDGNEGDRDSKPIPWLNFSLTTRDGNIQTELAWPGGREKFQPNYKGWKPVSV